MAGPIYWGQDAVIAAWTGFETVESLPWAPVRARSTFSGDLGWTTGNALYTLRGTDGSIIVNSPSKYLTIWARQPDGRWKYILDGGNRRPFVGP
jgi:ketosteroid isomerase-like protein